MESEFGSERCFGIVANMDFIMICTYEKDGADPELLLYKKRIKILCLKSINKNIHYKVLDNNRKMVI